MDQGSGISVLDEDVSSMVASLSDITSIKMES
jgi:hypothetical protein